MPEKLKAFRDYLQDDTAFNRFVLFYKVRNSSEISFLAIFLKFLFVVF